MGDENQQGTSLSTTTTYCCVRDCYNYARKVLSFHYFPSDENLRRRWEEALKMESTVSKSVRVCSDHFQTSDFFPGLADKKTRRLKKGAVPTKNLPPSTSQEQLLSPSDDLETAVQSENPCEDLETSVQSEETRQMPARRQDEDQQETVPVSENVQSNDLSCQITAWGEGVDMEKIDQCEKLTTSTRSKDVEQSINDPQDLQTVNAASQTEPEVGLYMGTTGQCEKVFTPTRSQNKEQSFNKAQVSEDFQIDDVASQTKAAGGIGTRYGPAKMRDAATQTEKRILIFDILDDPSTLFTYTGLRSFDLLNALTTCVSDLETASATRSKFLSLRERIVLTFTKLKLNSSFAALQPLFGVSRYTCARYFKDMVPKLAAVLQSVIPWPSQEEIQLNLPVAIANFIYTRIVIDCAETPVERSKCIKCRILTYSHYKKTHTVKFKIGVAPSGLITSVSRCYGGRASDKLITLESHLLDKLDLRDAVMADKGFFIEKECLERSITLHQPPFLAKKKQLSPEEAKKNAEIARARVHVERVIQRVREFEYVGSKVEWSLLPYFDDCLLIACGITNLSNPVLNIDKFL